MGAAAAAVAAVAAAGVAAALVGVAEAVAVAALEGVVPNNSTGSASTANGLRCSKALATSAEEALLRCCLW